MQWNKSVFSVEISLQGSPKQKSFHIILRVVLLFTLKENKTVGGWSRKLELSFQLPNEASPDPQPVSVSYCPKLSSILSSGLTSGQQEESRFFKKGTKYQKT